MELRTIPCLRPGQATREALDPTMGFSIGGWHPFQGGIGGFIQHSITDSLKPLEKGLSFLPGGSQLVSVEQKLTAFALKPMDIVGAQVNRDLNKVRDWAAKNSKILTIIIIIVGVVCIAVMAAAMWAAAAAEEAAAASAATTATVGASEAAAATVAASTTTATVAATGETLAGAAVTAGTTAAVPGATVVITAEAGSLAAPAMTAAGTAAAAAALPSIPTSTITDPQTGQTFKVPTTTSSVAKGAEAGLKWVAKKYASALISSAAAAEARKLLGQTVQGGVSAGLYPQNQVDQFTAQGLLDPNQSSYGPDSFFSQVPSWAPAAAGVGLLALILMNRRR